MTPEVVQKLEKAFSMSCNITEACLFADIARQTLYSYDKENPGFLDRMEQLRNRPNLKARMNIVESVDSGDKDASRWWLERRNKTEFAPRVEQTGSEGGAQIIQIIDDVK